jgi:DNA-binding winged helix-turn-helix (wHTH) protein
MVYRFGPFVADRTAYAVARNERRLDLTPKLLDLLFYLLERPATLVTKEELLDGVWPGANVTDNALAQAISDLRDALGDSPSKPAFIRTVARRGYRFVAEINTAAAAASPTIPAIPPHASTDAQGQMGPRTIAVLDFANVTGDPDVAWLSAGIAETVTSDLDAIPEFSVVDRWRVVHSACRTAGSLRDLGDAVGAALLVTGGFQRIGPQLRVTARLVDVARGEALADAKVDGRLEDVFSLQDGIVAAFAREIGVRAPEGNRPRGHETSSLGAYRAYTEGWLKIESLDTDLIGESMKDFEAAIALDPRYAAAHTGLANADFVAYEMTRAAAGPNLAALSAGIEHAQHAIQLDDRLAEAHATLSFLLTSAGRFDEARVAARRAVALESGSWRHQYRLGHAAWGDARLRALERALTLFPTFAYAHFEMAMVHVARGRLDLAEDIVRRGVAGQDRQAHADDRFPAIGLHWLLGAIRASRGDLDGAIEEFDRELAQTTSRRLYGPEYAGAALVGRGQAELAMGRPDAAVNSFRRSLTHVEGYARAHLGLATAHAQRGERAAAQRARRDVQEAIGILERTSRAHEAALMAAGDAVLHDGRDAAVARLAPLLQSEPASYLGWTVPLEPFLRPLHGHAGFARILSRLADRAR